MLLGLFSLAGCDKSSSTRQSTEQIRWKLAAAYPSTLPVLGEGATYYVERVRTITQGRLDIKLFEPNKLVPPLEMFDAVSKGSIDAAWSAPGYWTGKIPAAALFAAVPFGPDVTEYLTWIYQGGGLKLWREIYGRSNVVPIPCGLLPPEASGWFRKPIVSPQDFKGMKIRFYGLGGSVLEKLGASVQLLPVAETYPALESGLLDAAELSMPSIDDKLGFAKIAKYYYFPGWHQQASFLELLIAKPRWKELSTADKSLLESVCRDTIVEHVVLGESQQGSALRKLESQGVTINRWNNEILTAFRGAWQKVVKEQSAKDKDFRRVYKSYQTFRNDYARWADLSRLPAKSSQ